MLDAVNESNQPIVAIKIVLLGNITRSGSLTIDPSIEDSTITAAGSVPR